MMVLEPAQLSPGERSEMLETVGARLVEGWSGRLGLIAPACRNDSALNLGHRNVRPIECTATELRHALPIYAAARAATSAGTITIQLMPKRSTAMPKRRAKKVFPS